MEIRMRTLMAGPNGSRHPGEKCTVSAEEAEMLINAGYADPAEDGKKAEESDVDKPDPADPAEDGKKAGGKKK